MEMRLANQNRQEEYGRRIGKTEIGEMAVQHSGVWDQVAGSWKQLQGQVRTQWGKLTDDDLAQIRGQRDILAGKLQQRYGLAKEEANRQIDEWVNRLKF